MGSRSILDESEFGDEWILRDDHNVVREQKDDSQVLYNKSLSLQR